MTDMEKYDRNFRWLMNRLIHGISKKEIKKRKKLEIAKGLSIKQFVETEETIELKGGIYRLRRKGFEEK